MRKRGGLLRQSPVPYLASALALATITTVFTTLPAKAQVQQDDNSKERVESTVPCVKWQDDHMNPKGCVVLVHGLTQRGQCLSPLGKRLAADGYIVWAMDQRGHGFWHFGQKVGADGYKCNFKQSAMDLAQLLETIKQEHPGLPAYCIGESCGAAIIAQAAVKAPDCVNGIALCSAGVKGSHFKTSWVLHDVIAHAFRLDHPFDIIRYQRKYGSDNQLDFDEAASDPQVRRKLSPREIFAVMHCVSGTARSARKLDPTINLLVVEGENDKVLKPSSARKILHNAKTPYKELVIVPGCGHVMLGTNHIKPLVASSIENWLNRETSAATVAKSNLSILQ